MGVFAPRATVLGCRRAKKIERKQILTETHNKQKHIEAIKIGNKDALESSSPTAFGVRVKGRS